MFTEREVPEHILKKLREVDPKATLIWIGTGWLLAVQKRNKEAERKAKKAAKRILDAGVNADNRMRFLWYAFLGSKGLRPIHLYNQQECDERIVNDFQQRDFNFRNRAQETFEENLYLSSGEARLDENMETMREAVHSQSKELHRIIRGGTVHATPGLPGEE